jgi:hypothetical protein
MAIAQSSLPLERLGSANWPILPTTGMEYSMYVDRGAVLRVPALTVGRGFSPPARSCRAEARPTELTRRVFHRRAAESAEKKIFLPGVLGVLGGSMVFVFSCKVPSPLAAQSAATGIGPAPACWCSPAPTEHPAFVKRFGTAIRPNTYWIAAKANFQLYARLWPTRSGPTFPERPCAGSASS